MAAEEEKKRKKKTHAILVAYPLQGHVIPAVNLAVTLASNDVTISFINTHFIHHRTVDSSSSAAGGHDGDDIFSGVRGSGLAVRYSTVSDGLPLDFDRSLNHDSYMEALLHVMPAHVDAAVGRAAAEAAAAGEKITSLIADTFFVWGAGVADKYGLLYVSFWSEAALVYSLYLHLPLLRAHGHFDSPSGSRKDTISYIPGIEAIEAEDMPSYLQASDCSTVVHHIITKAFQEAKRADFILCNTVQELEPLTISALRTIAPFYAVGPVFPSGSARTAVSTSLWSESDCAPWLDDKPPGSVLYVSFGSYAHVSRRDLHEIARGLLLARQPFLWVLRPDILASSEDDVRRTDDPLPEGFREAAGGCGMVVQWCAQADVLDHPAVGGFLSHCGWNSVLESMWFGVPLLCFPLLTDQFSNRKLVVEKWGVGFDLCRGGGRHGGVTGVSAAEDVAAAVGRLFDRVSSGEVRKKTEEMKRVMEAALLSSDRNIKEFISNLDAAVLD